MTNSTEDRGPSDHPSWRHILLNGSGVFQDVSGISDPGLIERESKRHFYLFLIIDNIRLGMI